MFTWADPDVGRFMGTYGPRSAAETAAWLDEAMRHNRAQPRFAHNTAIIVAGTGECAGWMGCGKSSEPVGEYDFGYALRPACRGHGYAREALTALLAFCLHDLAVSSVWGECDVLNHRSAAVMHAARMMPYRGLPARRPALSRGSFLAPAPGAALTGPGRLAG